LSQWLLSLQHSRVVSAPGGRAPLILDAQGRLYLYRYWEYEQKLAAWLRRVATAPPPILDNVALNKQLTHLFGSADVTPDWQRVAALCAVFKPFCVIAGGPGTGKTTTVVKILSVLLHQHPDLRIELAAPTGKAAARLQESIAQAQVGMLEREFHATTLHRLLGTIPGSPYFRHHCDAPLALDVLVVDEASMVDLALMSKLCAALPAHARLILLGDRDQLASVEAGAVLGDICTAAGDNAFSRAWVQQLAPFTGTLAHSEDHHILQDCVVMLRHSHRFRADSGIGRVAMCINNGDSDAVLELLAHYRHDETGELLWHDSSDLEQLRRVIVQGFLPMLHASSTAEAFAAFGRFRVLCAHRHGIFGVREVNRRIERMLEHSGLLQPNTQWYPLRPLLITENDYSLNLFNGDSGIVRYADDGRLRAWFAGTGGELRAFLPARLPPHETVFAMTVHKSQGSEFDHVLIYLPDAPSPLLSRELLYTAVTRARQRVVLMGSEASIRQAVNTRSYRWSGLRDALSAP
jgi:exodeoxyribonuclease V alpha subunit